MKGCDALRDDLKAYLDGELPLARRLAVRRHLARCAACREEIAMGKRIGNELRAAETVPGISAHGLPPALRARILADVEGIAPLPGVMEPPTRRSPLPVWGAWAAAALTCLVLISRFGPDFPGTRKTASSSAPAAASRTRDNRMFEKAPAAPPAGSVVAEAENDARAKPPAPQPPRRMAAAPPPPDATMAKDEVTESALRSPARVSRPPRRVAAPKPRAVTATSAPLASAAKASDFQDTRAGGSFGGLQDSVSRRADLQVKVAGLDAGSAAVREMVGDAGGFVAHSRESAESGGRRIVLTLQVPAAQFEAVRSRVADLEKEAEFRRSVAGSPAQGMPTQNAPAGTGGAARAEPPSAPPPAKQETQTVRSRGLQTKVGSQSEEKRLALRTLTVELREAAPAGSQIEEPRK